MSHQSVAALARTLRGHVGLGKSRLETLCMLVVGMVGARTVNLTHIASAGARGVQIASTYRRLQRFFQHVDLGPDWATTIIARLIDQAAAGRSRSTGRAGRSRSSRGRRAPPRRRLQAAATSCSLLAHSRFAVSPSRD